jgi:hypothetical protein
MVDDIHEPLEISHDGVAHSDAYLLMNRPLQEGETLSWSYLPVSQSEHCVDSAGLEAGHFDPEVTGNADDAYLVPGVVERGDQDGVGASPLSLGTVEAEKEQVVDLFGFSWFGRHRRAFFLAVSLTFGAGVVSRNASLFGTDCDIFVAV